MLYRLTRQYYRDRRSIERMEIAINALHEQLAIERQISDNLQRALTVAVSPYREDPFNVEEFHEERVIDSFPDGEFVVPSAFDWERLAKDIIDNDQGGASGSW